jgi:hypothetical protein
VWQVIGLVISPSAQNITSGSPAPILPSAISRKWTSFSDDQIDLTRSQKCDVTHCDGLHLQLGGGFKIVSDVNGQPNIAADNYGPMAAHKCSRSGPKNSCQIFTAFNAINQQRRIAKFSLAVPNWDLMPYATACMKQRLELPFCHAKGNDAQAVGVDHRINVRPHIVDRAVDISFEWGLTTTIIDRCSSKCELNHVRGFNEVGSAHTIEQEAVWMIGMTHTDMAK